MKLTVGRWPAREFLAHRGLIALAAGCAAAEAALLCVVAPAARALAAQVTAVPPLAGFHDLRWLFGYQQSWPEFALLLVGLITARSVLNAGLVLLAWPADRPRPAAREAFGAAVSLTMVACLLLSPIVALTVGVAILPFSWPYLAALVVMLLISAPLSHGGIRGSWWRTLPPLRAVCWLLADFAMLSLAAAAIGRVPLAAAIPVSGLAGVANARAWFGVVRAATRKPAWRAGAAWPLLRLPLAPLAAVLSIALVIGMTRLAFVVGRGPRQVSIEAAAIQAGAAGGIAGGAPVGRLPGHGTGAGHRDQRDPVLVILGFGSACCGGARSLQPVAPGAYFQQFSYRGLNAAGQPLPHGAAASDLPLPELGNRITTQVQRLHQDTGRPVDIIAESEGTLGVDAMLATHRDLPLGSVVMMSPIVTPGQVSYPAGSGPGAGLIPAGELRAVVWFVGGLSPFGSSGAQTLISSVNEVGARFAASAARHHRVRMVLLVPLADAVTLPVCPLPRDVFVIPALHGDLLGTPAVKRMVHRFLANGTVHEPVRYKSTAELVAAAAAAWRMPEITPPEPACGR
ncbi:MAG TPA: hypothetical protein VMH35_02855 [Streptosporangiaceae bacterium]|nr:hypothetical protein [Streptosporangiaceae bacterium]